MSRPSAPPAASRALEPLAGLLWIFFWVWTGLVALAWGFQLEGGAETTAWLAHLFHTPQEAGASASPLAAAAGLLGELLDTVWLLLGAAICYLSLAAEQGVARARRWAGLIVLVAFLVAAFSVWTGWPLGSLTFSSRFGPRLGPVPSGWLLLWLILVLGGRELLRRLFPRAGHGWVAGGLAGLGGLTEWNLRDPALHERVFWLWMKGPAPWWHPLAWVVLAGALGQALRGGASGDARHPLARGAAVFLALQGVCLLAHLGRMAWK